MDDKSSDHGIMIKDGEHESVPGYFLKFASLNHPDPTTRPYLMVCQKKRKLYKDMRDSTSDHFKITIYKYTYSDLKYLLRTVRQKVTIFEITSY